MTYKPAWDEIDAGLRAGIADLADIRHEAFNYDRAFGFAVTLKDGRRTAFIGRLEDAVPAAIGWAQK